MLPLLDERLTSHTVTIRTLALLDGCRFPLERFRVGGVAVERLARSVLEGLGPRRDVAQVFFQNEILDPEWYTQVWFLIAEEERQISPGSISFRLGYDVLNLFFQPITALALYKVDYFATPIVVESDPGWRLERVRWSEPIPALVDDGTGNALEIPRTDYDVDTQEQRRFSAFLTFFEEGTQSIRDWRRFRLAGRRYLRGMQIAGSHPSSTDDSEDALLQYVFALEGLLTMPSEHAIADKIATRASWLVGTNDRVRNETFEAVKRLYEARSGLVHGGRKQDKDGPLGALDSVRDLVRRALLGLMALRHATGSEHECDRVLRTAPFDRGSQSLIATATEHALRLIHPTPEWLSGRWGPRYEPGEPAE